MKRITSIDVTRGLVMIIMALDHVRDLIHAPAIDQSPTNLATTTPVLFFTRWITYLCAPAFVFLAGTSAWLSMQRSGNIPAKRNFLLKRGLYLVVLEFVVVGFGLYFDAGFHTLVFEVIAAIGFGFIILSLLLKLPARIIAIIGLVIMAAHNLLPNALAPGAPMFQKVLMAFVRPGAFPFTGRVFVMAYPPIPWLGIMLVGFASGGLFQMPEVKRRTLFLRIGFSAILLFIVVRLINVYGDTIPWSAQKDGVFTFLSFMNITKYPPSLVFCLVTLGAMFLFLALSDDRENALTRTVSVYGKVPMFYFLLHFYLIHLVLLVVLFAQGFHWSQFDFASGNFGRVRGVASGLPLWAVYLIWASVVAALYAPCRWYGRFKATHNYWWLKYL